MKKQRARSKDEKHYRKEKILQSAKFLFCTHGYQKTTIEMIMKEAELSPASFYLYYKNKIEIYRNLNLIGIDIIELMITEAIKTSQTSYSEKIKSIMYAYLKFFREERELYEIIEILHLGQKEFFENLNLVPNLEYKTNKLLKVISSIIKEGVKSGEFQKTDPWKTTIALWGMLDGILILEVKNSISYTNTSTEELIDEMITIIMKGLKNNTA